MGCTFLVLCAPLTLLPFLSAQYRRSSVRCKRRARYLATCTRVTSTHRPPKSPAAPLSPVPLTNRIRFSRRTLQPSARVTDRYSCAPATVGFLTENTIVVTIVRNGPIIIYSSASAFSTAHLSPGIGFPEFSRPVSGPLESVYSYYSFSYWRKSRNRITRFSVIYG